MYETGTGVTKDLAQAAQWYRKVADFGIVDAQYKLGQFYQTGIGVNKDLVPAAQWYDKAAKQGMDEARYELGKMYFKGEGVTTDQVLAVVLLSQTAKGGYEPAAVECEKMVSQLPIAKLTEAANKNIREAQYQLGQKYKTGEGVAKDKVLATVFFSLAANQGLKPAISARDWMKNYQLSAAEIETVGQLEREWLEKYK